MVWIQASIINNIFTSNIKFLSFKKSYNNLDLNVLFSFTIYGTRIVTCNILQKTNLIQKV